MLPVFISYSHDSDAHRQRVLAFAERLRGDGVKVVIDRDHPGGPDEGWPKWCEDQIKRGGRILMVCTETYRRRYDQQEAPGTGLGVIYEADSIRTLLWKLAGRNNRVRPLLLDAADERHIPEKLGAQHRFYADQPDSYADLLLWLRGSDDVTADTGSIAWPAPATGYDWGLADRRPEFSLLRQMLGGQSAQRILLIEAPSGRGKSVLFAELGGYARQLGLANALLDFKGCPTLEDLFQTLLLDLDADMLSATRSAAPGERAYRLIEELQGLRRPLLLLLDTYEQASEDSRKWLELQLLPRLDRAPAVIVVIGGQRIPAADPPWHQMAERRQLAAIEQPEDWIAYIGARCQGLTLPTELIASFVAATNGEPSMLRMMLDNLHHKQTSGG